MSGEQAKGIDEHNSCCSAHTQHFAHLMPSPARDIFIVLTKTIIKSRIVQKLVKYLQKPKASHLRSISTLKSVQKPRLVQQRIFFKKGLSSKQMSSKHSVMEDAKIKTRIIHSKAGVSTTDRTTVRTLIHFLPMSVARQRLIQLHL